MCNIWTSNIFILRSIKISPGQIDGDVVKKTHFGGFDDEEEDESDEVGESILPIILILSFFTHSLPEKRAKPKLCQKLLLKVKCTRFVRPFSPFFPCLNSLVP